MRALLTVIEATASSNEPNTGASGNSVASRLTSPAACVPVECASTLLPLFNSISRAWKVMSPDASIDWPSR